MSKASAITDEAVDEKNEIAELLLRECFRSSTEGAFINNIQNLIQLINVMEKDFGDDDPKIKEECSALLSDFRSQVFNRFYPKMRSR